MIINKVPDIQQSRIDLPFSYKRKDNLDFFLVEIGAKRSIKLNAAELIQSDHNTNTIKIHGRVIKGNRKSIKTTPN